MPWGNSIFPLLIITSTGGFTGLFVYSPAPGAGNLVASITGANGTDPYGNSYFAGDAVYTAAGNFTAYGASPTTQNVSLNASGLSFAVTSAVLKGLITPFAGAGASGVPSLVLQSPSNIVAAGNNSQAFLGLVGESSDGTTGPFFLLSSFQSGSTNIQNISTLFVGSFAFASPGVAGGAATSKGPTVLPNGASGFLIGLTAAATPATATLLEVQGSAGLKNVTAPASVAGYTEPFAIGGHLDYVAGATGDTNTYSTGRLSLITTATTLINNTTLITITGLSFNVAAAKYRVSGVIRLTAAAAGVVQPFTIQVNGTATVTSMLLEVVQWNAEGTPTATLGVITALASDPTHIIGNLANNNVYTAVVDGSVTFSGAGTFFFGARGTLAAGDETATAQIGNFIDLMPVV